ncbi:osmotically inducible protein OsmC [Flavipsychrobacter stenotrophus]|uniref:Osmotically inducible protein OsmC n=1 Tax=Flavipsychrobacter stenotrophus TaxID=2077091 RepID=A0A2S7SZ87_9BACT|nr:OsmC family protein [Flavipsychrobacter stenotrophus]PQJ12008.1 osmotically inducible protein OsmC [Flavipsychrobacter stenotrophus]
MSIEHSYNVDVKWSAGRVGIMNSDELETEIMVATPPQFPGGVDKIWSPEHLFTAAVNSCLMTTFLSIAENSKLAFVDFSSHASGKLELVDGKYMMSEVTLHPVVTVADESERAKAERVLSKAETNCLISNSVRSKIIFNPEINISGSKN